MIIKYLQCLFSLFYTAFWQICLIIDWFKIIGQCDLTPMLSTEVTQLHLLLLLSNSIPPLVTIIFIKFIVIDLFYPRSFLDSTNFVLTHPNCTFILSSPSMPSSLLIQFHCSFYIHLGSIPRSVWALCRSLRLWMLDIDTTSRIRLSLRSPLLSLLLMLHFWPSSEG